MLRCSGAACPKLEWYQTALAFRRPHLASPRLWNPHRFLLPSSHILAIFWRAKTGPPQFILSTTSTLFHAHFASRRPVDYLAAFLLALYIFTLAHPSQRLIVRRSLRPPSLEPQLSTDPIFSPGRRHNTNTTTPKSKYSTRPFRNSSRDTTSPSPRFSTVHPFAPFACFLHCSHA